MGSFSLENAPRQLAHRKLGVSATPNTAITPACTGSVITRSAASGTLFGLALAGQPQRCPDRGQAELDGRNSRCAGCLQGVLYFTDSTIWISRFSRPLTISPSGMPF